MKLHCHKKSIIKEVFFFVKIDKNFLRVIIVLLSMADDADQIAEMIKQCSKFDDGLWQDSIKPQMKD